MRLIPFVDSHIDGAAALLQAHLPGASPSVLRALLARPRAAGVAALSASGSLIGYMIGNSETGPTVRGRSAWTYLGGHAVADGEDPDLYGRMYAWLFDRWLEQGCFGHYAMVPANDRTALDAWFALGFGMEQVHAIRETAKAAEPLPSFVRVATPEDLPLLMPLIHLIAHHQVLAPCWGANLPEADAERALGWAEALADPTCTCFLALDEAGQAGGFAMLSPADAGLAVPAGSVGLDVAATRPDLRGRGFGTAITRVVLDHAYRAGYTHMVTDWRSTNLLSRKFWPGQGFRPTHVRLTRRIDEKILWARPSAHSGV